jgi:hypothetical protein
MSFEADNLNFNPSFKILSYNILLEKSDYTHLVKADPSWKNYCWNERKKSLILKMDK